MSDWQERHLDLVTSAHADSRYGEPRPITVRVGWLGRLRSAWLANGGGQDRVVGSVEKVLAPLTLMQKPGTGVAVPTPATEQATTAESPTEMVVRLAQNLADWRGMAAYAQQEANTALVDFHSVFSTLPDTDKTAVAQNPVVDAQMRANNNGYPYKNNG